MQSLTSIVLTTFADDEWNDCTPVELLEAYTGKIVIEMDTPDDYIYLVFNGVDSRNRELYFSYDHVARGWLNSVEIYEINEHLQAVLIENNEYKESLQHIVRAIYGEFQEYVVGGASYLAINCKNDCVSSHTASVAREDLQKYDFDVHYEGRSGGYMALSRWKNSEILRHDNPNSLRAILNLINSATGDPELWANFSDAIDGIVQQVNSFRNSRDTAPFFYEVYLKSEEGEPGGEIEVGTVSNAQDYDEALDTLKAHWREKFDTVIQLAQVNNWEGDGTFLDANDYLEAESE